MPKAFRHQQSLKNTLGSTGCSVSGEPLPPSSLWKKDKKEDVGQVKINQQQTLLILKETGRDFWDAFPCCVCFGIIPDKMMSPHHVVHLQHLTRKSDQKLSCVQHPLTQEKNVLSLIVACVLS